MLSSFIFVGMTIHMNHDKCHISIFIYYITLISTIRSMSFLFHWAHEYLGGFEGVFT